MAAPGPVSMWVAGARPRTLPAAVVPVAVGTAVAVGEGVESNSVWARSLGCLLVAVSLQVGVNYANDYSDGVRGTDGERRVGPLRLVGSGLAEPKAVKRASMLAFAVAGVIGAMLAALAGWALLAVGLACLAAGWSYTGGPRPYGYLGLGEVFVFVFFGLVATVGSTYVVLERLHALSAVVAVAVGLWATALLVVNNLRDVVGDAAAGKRTLAVRLGDGPTRAMYVAMMVSAFVVAAASSLSGRYGWAALIGVPVAVPAVRAVLAGERAAELIAVLGTTARVQLVSGLALAAGLAISG